MSGIYVPVINCCESTLFKISSTESDDFLINGILPHNEDNDEDSAKITTVVEKIEKVYGKSVEDIPQQLSIINKDDSDIELQFDDSTQSITLGLISELHREENHLTFKSRWDYAVVTGDVAENFRLERVEFIEKKFEAVKALAAKEPDKKIIFLYINNDLPIPRGYDKNFPNIYVAPFTSDTKIEYIYAELFVPKFDSIQKSFLERAVFNKNSKFVANANFEKSKIEATSDNWNGYFIYGEGESGKTTFAYNLCTYLMAVQKYYAPIWISLDFTSMKELSKQRCDHFNGLTKYICEQLMPNWQENVGLSQIFQKLKRNKFILIIDNLEINAGENFAVLLRECFTSLKLVLPVIITSRYNFIDLNIEKLFSLKSLEVGAFSVEECKEIVSSNNSEFDKIPEAKRIEFFNLLAEKYATSPGLFTLSAKNIDVASEKSIDKKIQSLKMENCSVQDYFADLLKSSFLQLPEITKIFLYSFVEKLANKKFENENGLQKKDFLTDFDIKTINENLSILRELNFIYLYDDEYYKMKSLIYRILILSDFSFKEKDRFIDIRIKLETAIWGYVDNQIIENLVYEVRNTEFANIIFIKLLLKDAILANSNQKILDLLLKEIVYYGGDKTEAINEHSENDNSLLQLSLTFSDKSEVLSFLLNNGGDVNFTDEIGESLLHGVFSEIPDFEEKCNVLLKHGFDINKKDYLGNSVLHSITDYGTKNQMLYLIEHGADINAKNASEVTPLHIAAKKSDAEKVKLLLENHADINAKDLYGYQAIHYAVHNLEIFNILLSYGADIKARNCDGESLLDLLEMGPYIEWNPHASEETFFAKHGPDFLKSFENEIFIREKLQEYKVKRYFKPKGFSNNWFTDRLSVANYLYNQKEIFRNTMTETLDVLKEPFDDEENLLLRDDEKKTLLHYAVLNPDLSVTEYLLEKGLGVNVQDETGITPLHFAAQYSVNTKILELLINNGADISALDEDGNGVLHYAALNVNTDAIEYFLERNLDLQCRNKNGYTPIGLAAAYNPNLLCHKAFCNKSNPEDLEKCYFDGTSYYSDSELLFCYNEYTSIISACYELKNDNADYQKGLEWSYNYIFNSIENEELKKSVLELQNDKKNLFNTFLFLASYNSNPKLPVLWARAGGDLSFSLDGKHTALNILKKRSDWKYIKKQLKKARQKTIKSFKKYKDL